MRRNVEKSGGEKINNKRQAENPPVTEEKIKDYMFWAALYTLYYSVEERERMANEKQKA